MSYFIFWVLRKRKGCKRDISRTIRNIEIVLRRNFDGFFHNKQFEWVKSLFKHSKWCHILPFITGVIQMSREQV